jgi:predicted nucleotidyltransferase
LNKIRELLKPPIVFTNEDRGNKNLIQIGGKTMNTHMMHNNHLEWHWMHTLGEKMHQVLHSPKTWAVIALLALVSALIALAWIASGMESEPMTPYFREYPVYPPVVP